MMLGIGNMMVVRCGYSYMLAWFCVVIMTIHDIFTGRPPETRLSEGKIV